jgi:hypothetical protein
MAMAIAMVRFYAKGWISDFYLKPQYFFTYYGFEWASPPSSPILLYGLYFVLLLLSVCIMLGIGFRIAIVAFFFLFTYTELWDKAVYLNHYYLISLLSLLMSFLPMNAVASLDCLLRKKELTVRKSYFAPEFLLKLQVGSVYFFGGIAKIGYDWLILGQPLKIWLSSNQHLPVVGPLLTSQTIAWLVAWFAMAFDLAAAFLLYFNKTRRFIYPVVLLFHALTALLFPIGMFPWFMCLFTLIFFPGSWHREIMTKLFASDRFHRMPIEREAPSRFSKRFLTGFLAFQLLMPFRAWLYPGNPLWHEQGFRFSWRIMLMEKNGSVEFFVRETATGKEFTVNPNQFLSPRQVVQMSFQPDMILQFAHFLKKHYRENGTGETEIRAHAYVSLNGKGSRLLIDPEVDLGSQKEGWSPKAWITESPE